MVKITTLIKSVLKQHLLARGVSFVPDNSDFATQQVSTHALSGLGIQGSSLNRPEADIEAMKNQAIEWVNQDKVYKGRTQQKDGTWTKNRLSADEKKSLIENIENFNMGEYAKQYKNAPPVTPVTPVTKN
jgi:hypothetical protein